ncbi:uncharacterized protein LOC117900416 [Drosophila subobscura]|uniref:uncharacterized protein LOC117900416 n=1 Tax=Drosophila subobscura TaxID=7241 RepID=UPI00155A70D8|nr:uncharacterized protein LOC117900416 [Drosophila subobscura]XP_034666668.1 uncharacterized protein LOC117900416 [Drosophila subobscura]XP_034666669.1 uncharacterized protein LOC117900416 [Drosophila subobscura]
MAWMPSTRFENDLVDSQPGCNFVLGQMAYEIKREAEYTPRPPCTYKYLAARDKRNAEIDMLHGPASSKTKEIRDSLAMMERIQQIAGTKPLGEHATMADWNDTSTVEREAVAMMRHYGLMSMGVESMAPLPPKEEGLPKGPIHVLRNGHRKLPLITDPEYFRPRKTRLAKETPTSSPSTSFNDSGSFHTANDISLDSLYESAASEVETTLDSQDDPDVPYELLEEMTLEPEQIPATGPKKPTGTGSRKVVATGSTRATASGSKKETETGSIPKNMGNKSKRITQEGRTWDSYHIGV